MARALVLNAGAAWCAYQVGAIRHLVGERGMRYDICAGTGIGAMNAAFVACGQHEVLDEYWSGLRARDLAPWRRRRFLADHLSEPALSRHGTTLVVTALNLQSGRQEVLRYPGSSLPLVEAILAAGAMPGLTTPVRYGTGQLVEGTIVDAVPMQPVLDLGPEQVVAVLAGLPADGGPRRHYRTWRAVMGRAVAMNQAYDGRRALAVARAAAAEAEAYRVLAADLPHALAARAGDASLAERLHRVIDGHEPPSGPEVVAVCPSRDLGYPMWRFRRSQLAAAASLGERDARAARVEPGR